jgi:hypothetical protein
VWRVRNITVVERGREGGDEDRGTNTLPTLTPEDLKEMAGFWTVEKKANRSLEILRVTTDVSGNLQGYEYPPHLGTESLPAAGWSGCW